MNPEILASLIGTVVTAIATIIVAWIQAHPKKSEQTTSLLVPEGYKTHHPKSSRNWFFVVPIALLGGFVSYISFSWFYNSPSSQFIPTATKSPTMTPFVATPTPSPVPTPTLRKKADILENQWCVFIVPEDKDLTIRAVILPFLQEGQLAEDFRDDVYEATSGVVWHEVWYIDQWDYRPLPKDKLADGTIVTARVGLGFITYVEDCVDNGGKIYDRPPAQ